MGGTLVNGDGSMWELTLQEAALNRAAANPVHSVTASAATIRTTGVSYRRTLAGGDLQVGAGYEAMSGRLPSDNRNTLRAFVQWRGQFE